MQKKIVAGICAAALALAMPAAAIADSFSANDSSVVVNKETSTVTYTVSKVKGANADLNDLTVIGNSDKVKSLDVNPTTSNAMFIGGSNVIATQSFDIQPKKADGTPIVGTLNKNELGKSQVAGTIAFHWDDLVSTLPATIDRNNLYVSGWVQHSGANNVQMLAAPTAAAKSFSFDMDRASIVTAVLSNGPVYYDPAVGLTAAGATTAEDLQNAAADGKTSPKTGDIA